MGTFSRTILRKAARTKMEKAGITQMNKRRFKTETGETYSFFSKNWREFAPHKVEEAEEEE